MLYTLELLPVAFQHWGEASYREQQKNLTTLLRAL